jgi:DNA-binding transcriptional MocR family regulator
VSTGAITPALRLVWLVAPPDLADEAAREKEGIDSSSQSEGFEKFLQRAVGVLAVLDSGAIEVLSRELRLRDRLPDLLGVARMKRSRPVSPVR